MHLNRELCLILSLRGWQSLGGIITLVITSTRLTPEQQGWYYAFISIVALYTVFETGLSAAALQITAHKFINLGCAPEGLNKFIQADSQRFIVNSERICLITAFLFCITIYPIGILVFGHRASSLVDRWFWIAPWTVLVLMTSLSLFLLPIISVAEGSGAISEAYTVRLIQSVLGSILCWIALWNDAALWATSMTALAIAVVVLLWVSFYRNTFYSLPKIVSKGDNCQGDNEFWSLYWRACIGGVSVYFWSQLATPFVFFFQGSVEAGKIGLSLTIAHMVGIIAQSWIARAVPYMSHAAASKNWVSLREVFTKNFKKMIVFFFVCTVGVLVFRWFMSDQKYLSRILPADSFAATFIFVLFYLVNNAFAAQLRSFKREPLLGVFVLGGCVSLVGTLWSSQHSASAVIYTMVIIQAILVFPLGCFLWKKANAMLQQQ